MTKRTVARRALLAVVLMVGFYLLALVIVAVLLAVPYREWRLMHRVEPQLLLVSVITSGIILWLLLPRRDRFVPPTARTEARDATSPVRPHPRHRRTSWSADAGEVYLIPDVNAAVSERGGVMGRGSRRVMLIGYGLLEAFTVSQLRATLAHEFGHYHHGDTKLGPWIYKTRQTIERTLANVQGRSWLARPFAWYWTGFMRLTQAVAREQEFHADAVAAQMAGARASQEVLRQLPGVSTAFDAFWRGHYAPAVQAGLCPPLGEGFAAYLRAPQIAQAVRDVSQEELAVAVTHPYASHPSLAERLAALDGLPLDEPPLNDPPALSLLDHPNAVEGGLLQFLVGCYLSGDNVPGLSAKMYQTFSAIMPRDFRQCWTTQRQLAKLLHPAYPSDPHPGHVGRNYGRQEIGQHGYPRTTAPHPRHAVRPSSPSGAGRGPAHRESVPNVGGRPGLTRGTIAAARGATASGSRDARKPAATPSDLLR